MSLHNTIYKMSIFEFFLNPIPKMLSHPRKYQQWYLIVISLFDTSNANLMIGRWVILLLDHYSPIFIQEGIASVLDASCMKTLIVLHYLIVIELWSLFLDLSGVLS